MIAAEKLPNVRVAPPPTACTPVPPLLAKTAGPLLLLARTPAPLPLAPHTPVPVLLSPWTPMAVSLAPRIPPAPLLPLPTTAALPLVTLVATTPAPLLL